MRWWISWSATSEARPGPCARAMSDSLNGYRATIHWENLASLASEHESLEIGSDLFEIETSEARPGPCARAMSDSIMSAAAVPPAQV
jgi:uncharacterized membrane protein